MSMKIRLALASTAAILVAAVIVYLVTRAPRAESLPRTTVESQAAPAKKVETVDAPVLPGFELPTMQTRAVPQRLAADELPVDVPPISVPPVAGTIVLRVILEGITEEDAPMTTVTVTGVDTRIEWPCQGLTSEFDLDPFLASVERHENLRVDELQVEVDHPHHLRERLRVPLSRDGELTHGKTVYELRVQLVPPEYWPEFTLAVRDAHTRAHLEEVELRIAPGLGNAVWGQNGTSNLLGGGLSSPMALMGGREPDEPEVTVAGLALRPGLGGLPRLVELAPSFGRRWGPDRGVIVSARAPGYAWGSITLDVTEGDRELLLEPATELSVRLANVQLERYAALETAAMLCVYRLWADGGYGYVRFEPLDESIEAGGLWLQNLTPGEYAVAVELVGGSWTQRPVLAREEISLAAGETRELVLALDDPPRPPERATLGGVLSFPAFGGEDSVRLQLFEADGFEFVGARARYQTTADVELSLADLKRVGGALPTWSFRLEDVPIGLYQVHLRPFQKSWMIELPAGGREGVELVIPELAEVSVETIDAHTGERIPIDALYFGYREFLPGQVHKDRLRADTEEPGRFRFWTAPGAVTIWPSNIPSDLDYGQRSEELELVPGFQSVRFEFEPVYAFRIEFREGGAALHSFSGLAGDAYAPVKETLRAIEHEGRLTHLKLSGEVLFAEVSAPGVYEIRFEGVGAERFHPILPRLVDVRAGETTEVIVELHRK